MQGEGEREKEVGSWLGTGRPSVMCVFCAKDFVAAKLQALSAAAAVVVDTQIALCVCQHIRIVLSTWKSVGRWVRGKGTKPPKHSEKKLQGKTMKIA